MEGALSGTVVHSEGLDVHLDSNAFSIGQAPGSAESDTLPLERLNALLVQSRWEAMASAQLPLIVWLGGHGAAQQEETGYS